MKSNFLNQIKKFDAIVEARFFRDPVSYKGYLIIDETYKGRISNDTISLYEGGTDCTEVFDEDRRETYIIGLDEFSGNGSYEFTASSCITSVLTVKEDYVVADSNLHVKNPRISFSKSKMRKDRLVKKIRTRL